MTGQVLQAGKLVTRATVVRTQQHRITAQPVGVVAVLVAQRGLVDPLPQPLLTGVRHRLVPLGIWHHPGQVLPADEGHACRVT